MVYVEYSNSEGQDKDLLQFKDTVPSILKINKDTKKI